MRKILLFIVFIPYLLMASEMGVPFFYTFSEGTGSSFLFPFMGEKNLRYFSASVFYKNWDGADVYYLAEYCPYVNTFIQQKIFAYGFTIGQILKTDINGNIVGDYNAGYNVIGYNVRFIKNNIKYGMNLKIKNDYIDNVQYYSVLTDIGILITQNQLKMFAGISNYKIFNEDSILFSIGTEYSKSTITIGYLNKIFYKKSDIKYDYLFSLKLKINMNMNIFTEYEKKGDIMCINSGVNMDWNDYSFAFPFDMELYKGDFLSVGIGFVLRRRF